MSSAFNNIQVGKSKLIPLPKVIIPGKKVIITPEVYIFQHYSHSIDIDSELCTCRILHITCGCSYNQSHTHLFDSYMFSSLHQYTIRKSLNKQVSKKMMIGSQSVVIEYDNVRQKVMECYGMFHDSSLSEFKISNSEHGYKPQPLSFLIPHTSFKHPSQKYIHCHIFNLYKSGSI